ncbi:MAG TPA: lysophospholipid acyltransferase family protein [Burkholderiales bacterium]|nr:1-acyl-sn-glycerol-3-phosphate acyltransferase [Pseudomonadota bacterium]HVC50093.1 lysophospholipid acyltransferase family protein [Burkholderiales bacterium]
MWILGVSVHLKGDMPQGGALLVANHLSWLDIFVINCHRATHFVAKSEIRTWPVLGFLVTRAGTFYLDRGRGRDALRVMQDIRAILGQGEWVALFPEGGIGDGKTIHTFRSFLFESVAGHALEVCPLAICYVDSQGKPHTAPAWFDIPFVLSFIRIISARRIIAEILVCKSIMGNDRRMLAHEARESIMNGLGFPLGSTVHSKKLSIVKTHRSQ